MNKQAILAEEQRLGVRLLELRRQYNSSLSGGAKQLTITTQSETQVKNVNCSDSKTLDCLRKAVQATGDIWTHKNVLVADQRPALGPWMNVEQLLGLSKPHIHIDIEST